MATVTGQMSTTTVASQQLAIDVGDQIALLEPDSNPLLVFSRAISKKAAVNPKFKWLEDESKARFDKTSNTATNSATAVEVENGTYYQQWDQVLNTRTGEQFRVDAVVSNTLTVTRGIGSTGTAMNSGDELLIIGTAQPEGDTSKVARSKQPTVGENYTQIFRTPWEVTGTLEAVEFMVQPKEFQRLSRNAGIEHGKDIEYHILLGRKSATNPGPNEARTTGGALSFITTNQTDAAGNLSETEFNAACAQGFRYGSKSKLLLASAVVVQALEKFPAGKQITNTSDTTYGVKVTGFQSLFGTLNLVYHPLLEGTKYGGYGIGLDINQINYRFLANGEVSRDTKVRPNIQLNDMDGRKDELLSECGLELGLQRTHFLLTNVTS